MPATAEVGFIGIGAMGARIATRLLEEGHPLSVCDRRPEALTPLIEAGARAAGSFGQLAEGCETILLCLPTPEVVGAVTGELHARGALKMCIDLSTT
ncbi:MAG: NAD(P)-binding domain-containing protein, partial [Solirubrobacteraceae bacterium]